MADEMTTPCHCCGGPARVTRRHDDATEYECPACRSRGCADCTTHFTLKAGDPAPYAFFPADIAAMFAAGEGLQPLFGGGEEG